MRARYIPKQIPPMETMTVIINVRMVMKGIFESSSNFWLSGRAGTAPLLTLLDDRDFADSATFSDML